jgi:signal transduction histidine kinase
MSEVASDAALLSVKFELAMSIGGSLDLPSVARRFMVPLLQTVQGASCQLWLRGPQGHTERLAYPHRSLKTWVQCPRRAAWLAETATLPHGPRRRWAMKPGVLHALPVGEEGWLFIECDTDTLDDSVLDAIGVVLLRLAHAIRACREHARAHALLAEKAAAEAGLQEANARMGEVFLLSSNGFANFDRTGRLTFCNPQVGEMLGFEVQPGLALAELDQRLASVREGPEPWADRVGTLLPGERAIDRLVFATPRLRILHCTLRRTPDDTRVILFLRDITHESEVNRMKTEFLNTAAHELRTPMASVYGFSELLLTRDLPEPKRRKVVETIHRQAAALVSMVNELLDLARIEARQHKELQRARHRLAELVEPVVEGLLVNGDPRRAALEIAHPAAEVEVDAEKFRRALTNVLSNAFKYSPDGGAVRVTTLGPAVMGDGDRQGLIGIRVTDQGIGMTPEQCARVFERFFRADPSGSIPGTGLGMSLVKEIVELHGGRIEVESEPGRGTAVTMWWPLADPASTTAASD